MRTHENLIRASEWPLISPHKNAPLYVCPHEAQQELLRQAIAEITSENGFNVGNPDVRELLRQSALVNMFFYLRFVLGFSGPYTLLTPDLHLDMCNFYQLTREKGTWAFGCLFRKGYKSQTWTCGGTSWDILRDPNWEEILASNVIERSIEFNSYIQDGFENNELMAVLFPEYVPATEGRTEAWNSKMTRVPCKRGKKPNVRVVAVGGSIQGLHGNSFKIDDLIGEHMLDANRKLGTDNEKARNWMISAVRNIPNSKAMSNIFVDGTRYGPDDAYKEIWKSIKKFYGYTLGEPFVESPTGEWSVYYRSITEDTGDGKATSILPQVMTDQELETIQREDPWTYWTQWINMSTYSGLSELIDYHTRECTLDTDADGQLVVTYVDHVNGKHVDTPLAHLDVIAACDPAASSERKSIRTSKSAYGVVARSHDNRYFVIHLQSGYVPVTTIFDWLFDGFKKFQRYIRSSVVEMQGPFKVLRPLILAEQQRRDAVIRLRPVSAKGDKDQRIRSYLQPEFERGAIYAVKSAEAAIRGEMQVFPDGHQKDVLDMLALAIAASVKPREHGDDDDDDDVTTMKRKARIGVSPVTGY